MRSLPNQPFLKSLCWQGHTASVKGLSDAEIVQLYERNWHYRGVIADLSETEKVILLGLAKKHRSWLINQLETAPMTFRHSIHNDILQILSAVNHDFFRDCSILFGDGTMLALSYGEYRLSRDIDFLCPYGEPFSTLRCRVFEDGYSAVFNLNLCDQITFPGDIIANSYGIRFAVQTATTTLKVALRLAFCASSFAQIEIALNTILKISILQFVLR